MLRTLALMVARLIRWPSDRRAAPTPAARWFLYSKTPVRACEAGELDPRPRAGRPERRWLDRR